MSIDIKDAFKGLSDKFSSSLKGNTKLGNPFKSLKSSKIPKKSKNKSTKNKASIKKASKNKATKAKATTKKKEERIQDVDEFDFIDDLEEEPGLGDGEGLGLGDEDPLEVDGEDEFGLDDEDGLGLGDEDGLSLGDEDLLEVDGEDEFGLDDEDGLGLDTGEDLDFGNEGGSDFDMDEPSEPKTKKQPKAPSNEELEKATSRIRDLEDSTAKMNATVSMMTQSNDEVLDKLKKMEESSLQFLSLYELVSDQINPFVSDSSKSTAVMERFDKLDDRIGQLEELTSLVSRLENKVDSSSNSDLEQTEMKFNNIYQTMTELKEKQEEIEAQKGLMDETQKNMIIEEIESIKKSLSENPPSQGVADSENLAEQSTQLAQLTRLTNTSESNDIRLTQVGNDPIKVLALIRWIEFLMGKVGRNNFLETLNYYVQIRWISKDIRNQMIEYAKGIEHYEDKPEWRLSPEDHKKSLLLIETIRGTELSMTTINLTEQEISKLKNAVEGQYGI